jgi:hydrocephalus-inducing protein
MHPKGCPLELVGESCIPGIDAEDFEGIFEEHAIEKEIDPSRAHGTVYGTQDRVRLNQLQLSPPGTRSCKALGERVRTHSRWHSQVFSFGNVLADLAGTGDESCSVHAQLKFTNATKVITTVQLSVMPDSKDDVPAPYPINVTPKSIEIPPHEYQFVSLSFHPRQIMAYSAIFQALVENGEGRPETQGFKCTVQVWRAQRVSFSESTFLGELKYFRAQTIRRSPYQIIEYNASAGCWHCAFLKRVAAHQA